MKKLMLVLCLVACGEAPLPTTTTCSGELRTVRSMFSTELHRPDSFWPRASLPLRIESPSADEQAAMDYWNSTVGREVFSTEGHPVRVFRETFIEMSDRGAVEYMYLRDGCSITLAGVTNYTPAKDPVMRSRHALGHLLGLDHTAQGLMTLVPSSLELDQGSLEQLAHYQLPEYDDL